MKLTYLTSASVIIEDQNVKILCDPWFVDGEYYGSWYHYPKFNFIDIVSKKLIHFTFKGL